jgi:hypothetical protein
VNAFSGAGMILFDEFAHWGLSQSLDLEDDDENDDIAKLKEQQKLNSQRALLRDTAASLARRAPLAGEAKEATSAAEPEVVDVMSAETLQLYHEIRQALAVGDFFGFRLFMLTKLNIHTLLDS